MTADGKYDIPDVSASVVMDAVHRVDAGSRSYTTGEIARALNVKQAYASRAVRVGTELQLLVHSEDGRLSPGREADQIRRSQRHHMSAFFRKRLQEFYPFQYFVLLLDYGLDTEDAARSSMIECQVASSDVIVRKSLVNWGKFAGLLEDTDDGIHAVGRVPDVALKSYLQRLAGALQADFESLRFVNFELGTDTVSYLHSIRLDIQDVANALTAFESDPRSTCQRTGNFLETFLASLQPKAGSLPRINIAQIADSLLSQQKILRVHRSLSYGVSGFRNAQGHGSDPDTGRPWEPAKPDTALAALLLGLVCMRSIHRYRAQGRQGL